MTGATDMTWVFFHGEMFMSPLTSGFTVASDATAGLVVVVYGHSEGFGEVCHIGPLSDRSGIEPR